MPTEPADQAEPTNAMTGAGDRSAVDPTWLAAADAALAGADLPDVGAGTLRLGYRIGGAGPGDPDVTYHLRIEGGSGHVGAGLGDAPVVLEADAATAAAMRRGAIPASAAIVDGRLRVHGAATDLLVHRPVLEAARIILADVPGSPTASRSTGSSSTGNPATAED